MARVTDKGQLKSWLARVYPPSSPTYLQPAEIPPVMQLVIPALPQSLVYERMGYQRGVTVNPATQLFFPSVEGGAEGFGATQAGVPFGKYYWLNAARWVQDTAASSVAGRAWIALRNVAALAGQEFGLAAGFFTTTSLTDFLDLRAPTTGQTAGSTMTGGGGGPIVIPPGYCLHFSTAATPAGTTIYVGQVHYCVLDIGEIHP
jgi:hypothetical protein